MNKEHYAKLEKYEKYLDMAVKTHSVVGLLRVDKRAINEVYGEMGFKALTPSKMLCDYCVMQMLETVGAEYFKYKNKYANRLKRNDKAKEEEGNEGNSH